MKRSCGTAKIQKLRIIANKQVAPDHFVLECEGGDVSPAARPGQFVQITLGAGLDPLLPRPFSFLDTTRRSFKILYQVVGRGTRILSKKQKGQLLDFLGPLGNGFEIESGAAGQHKSSAPPRPMLLVGGGVGIPPLYHLARTALAGSGKRRKDRIKVFLGGRTRTLLHCRREFMRLGVKVLTATDDGTHGRKGFVTEILDAYLQSQEMFDMVSEGVLTAPVIYACGPLSMLKALSMLSEKYGIECQVSVEEKMPCGFGACLGCAIKVRQDRSSVGAFRYAMSCSEGPVFYSKDVLWD